MTPLQEEIMEKISRLTEDQLMAVYEFILRIEDGMQPRYYTPYELMQLSDEERHRILDEQLPASEDDDTES